MYKAISEKIRFPDWADTRYREMATRELFLRGHFYDHLPNPFSAETRSDGEYIPILERRPSVPYNLPRAISAETRRWLWSGRNCPRLMCEDEDLLEAAQRLVRESGMIKKMAEATFFGSVGSVAVTFQIRVGADGYPRVMFDTWRAKDCQVTFNDVGELTNLRVQYICPGRSFLAQGITHAATETGPSNLDKPIERDKLYWFTRDYTDQWVITYRPLEEGDYNPREPSDQRRLIVDIDRSTAHALGFVPGEWIQNLPGGEHPDGDCTWWPALNTAITLDYTLSMIPRGLWYNLCPQLVIEGELLNQGVDQNGRMLIRGPSNVLQMAPLEKGVGGQQHGGGQAYLLESNGAVFGKAVEIVDAFKKIAKEQIQASRKDPDKLTSAQSGVAVDTLEQEHMGLVQELRQSYGEDGYMPLLRKVTLAAYLAEHPLMRGIRLDPDVLEEELSLQWPREIISAQDFSLIEPALMDAVERKMVPAEDIAGWIRTHLDLPFRADTKLDEDAGSLPKEPEPKGQAKDDSR